MWRLCVEDSVFWSPSDACRVWAAVGKRSCAAPGHVIAVIHRPRRATDGTWRSTISSLRPLIHSHRRQAAKGKRMGGGEYRRQTAQGRLAPGIRAFRGSLPSKGIPTGFREAAQNGTSAAEDFPGLPWTAWSSRHGSGGGAGLRMTGPSGWWGPSGERVDSTARKEGLRDGDWSRSRAWPAGRMRLMRRDFVPDD